MNKKAQFDLLDDINWAGFMILCIIGIVVIGGMMLIWKKMDFEVAWYVKVGMLVAVPIASIIFSKIFFE